MVFRKSDNENFDSTNILLFLYKWQKPLLIVTVVAFIAAIVFSSSFFIKPKYKSTVILYPAATSAISKSLLSENASSEDDILSFGEDEETEQMLQILHSNRIRDRIIEKYDLMNHYGIDSKSNYKITRLYNEYENNITFKRTEFMAVKISVLDTDPQLAADIANDIASLLDSTKNQMQHERANKAYEIVRDQYFKLRNEVAMMEDSLTKLRELGVNDYESQSEMINQQLAIELANGNTQAIKRLEDKLEILSKYGGPYVSLRDALEHEKKQLSMLKAKYEEAKTDAEEVLPTKFIVNSAYKAERKSYPIRWLIVLVTVFSAFLLTLIVILILENLQEFLPVTKDYLKPLKTAPLKKYKLPEDLEKPAPPGDPPRRVQANPVNQPRALDSENEGRQQEKKTTEIKNEIKSTENKPAYHEPIKTETTETRENQMESYFANMNFLKILNKWKIHLGVILILALVLASIFSGPAFVTPMYKSFALVYPSNVQPYSEESESEQMLQYFQSKEIKDKIIRKYDLAKRYKIDPSYEYFQSAMLGKYNKNISISRTPYDAVRIDVLDSDPQVACDIVNDIINFYNQKVLETHRQKYKEVVDFLAARLENKRLEIDEIEKKHHELRTEYGLVDYPNQSREIARGFLGTVDGNNAQNVNKKEVLKLKKNLEEKGGEFIFYNDRYFDIVEEYGGIKMDYENALMNYERNISYASVVSEPFPADKKSFPVRWIILALTAIASLFFSFIIILIIENYHSIQRKI
jgi:uncharacterized protein involved in exopolysaccharide biosynthesis